MGFSDWSGASSKRGSLPSVFKSGFSSAGVLVASDFKLSSSSESICS
jgi:hypothetical protein